MEQMRRYGIPASVTLAQGICESASGQSELSRKGNNHFGIKATSGWVQNGGKYLVYTDQAAVIKAIKEGKTNVDLNAPTTPEGGGDGTSGGGENTGGTGGENSGNTDQGNTGTEGGGGQMGL